MLLTELGENIRFFVLNCFCMGMASKLTATLLKKRRSLLILWIYLISKTVFEKIICGNILMKHFGELSWLPLVYALLVYTFSVLTGLVFCYTFQGSFVKILLAAFVSEIIATFILNISFCAVNFIEGKPFVIDYINSFQPIDCMIFLGGGG